MRTAFFTKALAPCALAIVGLAGCSTIGDRDLAKNQESSAAQTSAALTYRDLIRIAQPLHSVDALLDKLSTDYPSMLQNFALVYQSRSLQSASRDYPRVILFGPGYDFNTGKNTQLVIAFPGDPSKSDFQTLEVLSMDDGASAIRTTELRFPGGTTGSPVIDEQPAKCATCHGSSSTPIWDSYPVWPGAYGGNEDVVDDRIGELTSFRSMATKFGQAGRYHRLQLHTQSAGDGLAFGSSAPNEDLQVSLNVLEMRQIKARLQALPQYPALKYALLGATGGCLDHGSDGWLSPSAAAAIGVAEADVTSVAATDLAANHAIKAKRFFNAHGEAVPAGAAGELRSIDEVQHVAGVRFVSLLLGDDMRSWSMSLMPRAFSFATRGLENLFFSLYDDLKTDPVVAGAVQFDGTRLDPQVNCPKLAAASAAAITDAVARDIGSRAQAMRADLASDGLDRQAPILRCMSCHTDPYVGPDGTVSPPAPGSTAPPYFPFDQTKALGALLAANGGEWATRMTAAITAAPDASNRMPKAPRAPLSAAEQAAFTAFIQGLVAQ